MKIITEAMVETHLTMMDCIAAMRGAMLSVSRGETTLPIRQYMPISNTQGKMALMPGTITSPDVYGIKLVCKYVREPDSPYEHMSAWCWYSTAKLDCHLQWSKARP